MVTFSEQCVILRQENVFQKIKPLQCCYYCCIFEDKRCSSICKIWHFFINRSWWSSESRRTDHPIHTTNHQAKSLGLGDLVGLPGCDSVSTGLSLWSWDFLISKPPQTPHVYWVGPSFAETQEAQLDHTGRQYRVPGNQPNLHLEAMKTTYLAFNWERKRKTDTERGPDCLVTESLKCCELPKREHIVFVNQVYLIPKPKPGHRCNLSSGES